MKKIFFPLIAIAFFLSSCGYDCDHDYVVSDTYYTTVGVNEWKSMPFPPDGDGPYLFCSWKLPAITKHVIDNGVVLVYCIESGRDNLLPYLRPWGINQYNEPFFQNIRFDIEPGWITFVIEASDWDYPEHPTGGIEFKVTVLQPVTH